jgi:preprotein translocase subunit SecG
LRFVSQKADGKMQTVLIVVHMLIVIALIAVVLLQRSEGGALGIGGGSNSFFTGRGQANALTRATAILATLFFMTSLALTILASYSHSHKSIFESPAAGTAAPASAPGKAEKAPAAEKKKGSLLEQLKKLEKEHPPAPPEAGQTPEQAPPRAQ